MSRGVVGQLGWRPSVDQHRAVRPDCHSKSKVTEVSWLIDARAAEALSCLGLRERGDCMPGRMLIFSVICTCPHASRPRPLELLGAERSTGCVTIRSEEAVGLLNRGQPGRADG